MCAAHEVGLWQMEGRCLGLADLISQGSSQNLPVCLNSCLQSTVQALHLDPIQSLSVAIRSAPEDKKCILQTCR